MLGLLSRRPAPPVFFAEGSFLRDTATGRLLVVGADGATLLLLDSPAKEAAYRVSAHRVFEVALDQWSAEARSAHPLARAGWPDGATVYCPEHGCATLAAGGVAHVYRSGAVLAARGLVLERDALDLSGDAEECARLFGGALATIDFPEDTLVGNATHVFVFRGGRLAPVAGEHVLESHGWQTRRVYAADLRDYAVDAEPLDLADGTFFHYAGNGSVLYKAAAQRARPVLYDSVLTSRALTLEHILTVPSSHRRYELGEPLGFPDGVLVACSGGLDGVAERVYLIEGGQRRVLLSRAVAVARGLHEQPVFGAPCDFLEARHAEGAPIGLPDGSLFAYADAPHVQYMLQGGRRRQVISDEVPGHLGMAPAEPVLIERAAADHEDGEPLGFLEEKRRDGSLPDAMFVWMALPADSFWVNLNPSRPDLIMHDAFSTTEVGMVLLEADLEMKKHVASLIHPDTELGASFWHTIYSRFDPDADKCFSFRQWIVPGNVTVVRRHGALEVLNATLDVQMESTYLRNMGEEVTSACPAHINPAIPQFAEDLFRSMILPRLARAINTDAKFYDMRTLFQYRIMSQFFQGSMDATQVAAFEHFKQHKLAPWNLRTAWTPRRTFDKYLVSARRGEFALERERQEPDGQWYVYSYFYGGIDLAQAPQSLVVVDGDDARAATD